jgi:hypothetical protein
MRRNRRSRWLRTRFARTPTAALIAAWLAGCTCPSPITLDQTFTLDATPGSPPPDGSDAGALGAGGAADATPSAASDLDCTPAADDCKPGSSCEPACVCVLRRDHVKYLKLVSCRLLEDAGPPRVEAQYQEEVFCGGD